MFQKSRLRTSGKSESIFSYEVLEDRRLLANCGCNIELVDLNSGVAVWDAEQGQAYLMYSSENLKDRFSSLPPGNSDHFLAVRHNENLDPNHLSQWEYHDGTSWSEYHPSGLELIVAELDFTEDEVVNFAGQRFFVDEIQAGYVDGDLVVTPNQWNGQPNGGEFDLSGTYIRAYANDGALPSGNLFSGISPAAPSQIDTAYLMYSRETIDNRFGEQGAFTPFPVDHSKHFSIVRYLDQADSVDEQGSWWEFSRPDIQDWEKFFPTSDDVLVGRIDLANNEFESLHGKDFLLGGITAGFVEGPTFKTNSWNGSKLKGAFEVEGTFLRRAKGFGVYESIGDLGFGIDVIDSANGHGFLMFSQEKVQDRFNVRSSNADHFVAVRRNQGEWQVSSSVTNQWEEFSPKPDDLLVAKLDFSSDRVNSFQGVSREIQGIRAGYLGGDLDFEANVWNGSYNVGEFSVTGSFFNRESASQSIFIANTNRGVAVADDAVGDQVYMMYSEESVHSRLINIVPDNADNFIVVNFDGERWYYNNNSIQDFGWVPLNPRSTDLLVAKLDRSLDGVTHLRGRSFMVEGIRAGYLSSKFSIVADSWNGGPNDGEYEISASSDYIYAPSGVRHEFNDVSSSFLFDIPFTYVSENRYIEQSLYDEDGSEENRIYADGFAPFDAFYDFNVSQTSNLNSNGMNAVSVIRGHGIDNNFVMNSGYSNFELVFDLTEPAEYSLGFSAFETEFGNISVSGPSLDIDQSIQFLFGGNPRVVSSSGILDPGQYSVLVWAYNGPVSQGFVGRFNFDFQLSSQSSTYVMYTPLSVAERFGIAGNEEMFVPVRFGQDRWQYRHNSQWHAFQPNERDLLVAEVDLGQVTTLRGQDFVVSGMSAGFYDSDYEFVVSPDPSGSGVVLDIAGTYLAYKEGPSNEFDAGNPGRGVAVTDNATGRGYLMYSRQDVQSRFGLIPENAEHFVAVRQSGIKWQFNDNSTGWIDFAPQVSDVLVASVNFTSDQVTTLVGRSEVIGGISAGYTEGDLTFRSDFWNGAANDGEFEVRGAYFKTELSSFATFIGDLNRGVDMLDSATGEGFLMYSEANVHDRFQSLNQFNADHFVSTRYYDSKWWYSSTNGWDTFAPQHSDVLIARVDFSRDSVESLGGGEWSYEGIRAGYTHGDMAFAANLWNGGYNDGEVTIFGSYFRTTGALRLTYDLGDLNSGVSVDDLATGNGYLMYTARTVSERFPGLHPENADHFVAVRRSDNGWQYNNDASENSWVDFLPEELDLLVAEVDFDLDIVNDLHGQEFELFGIEAGYPVGDIQFVSNSYGDLEDEGEFAITGTRLEKEPGFENALQIGDVRRGVAMHEPIVGISYIMYSADNVQERFNANPNQAENFVGVQYQDDGWYYSDNSGWVAFTPQATDLLVAEIQHDPVANTITSLRNTISVVQGINAGFFDGDLEFQADYWNGGYNYGEFGVSGTFAESNFC